MSIATDILDRVPGRIEDIKMDRHVDYHGEPAIKITAILDTGHSVEGTFVTQYREGFGGVDFSQKVEVADLMVAKINSVLKGTHDAN